MSPFSHSTIISRGPTMCKAVFCKRVSCLSREPPTLEFLHSLRRLITHLLTLNSLLLGSPRLMSSGFQTLTLSLLLAGSHSFRYSALPQQALTQPLASVHSTAFTPTLIRWGTFPRLQRLGMGRGIPH
uniref:Uncharacterized protein n=1 Tax=Pipistrellus kuhlii TaxID=59472 RepID=A0A7J7XBZ3_PIPKU|nr:hypothetical protein mPipKuh1_010603 [Pipistrellus kuhlii]